MQCTCEKCQGHGIGHNSSWIRVKEQQGAKSAGGLKVKALGQTLRETHLVFVNLANTDFSAENEVFLDFIGGGFTVTT